MRARLLCGDAAEQLRTLEPESVNVCVTSPPYYNLRDYGIAGQIGREDTPDEYIENLVSAFREVRRVLKKDGTLWVNIGDSYTGGNRKSRDRDRKVQGREMAIRKPTPEGLKPKELLGIPWRLAMALQADGWYLRSDIIWNKLNAMPESVKDRPTRSHEYIFLLSRSQKYYFDMERIKEPCVTPKGKKWRNKRDVWAVGTTGFKGDHFAVFPEKLIEPCILAGCPEGGIVLDPFTGSGTTGVVAMRLNRGFVGIEINTNYSKIAAERMNAIGTTGEEAEP